jgi:hypothetical protein
MVIMKEVLREKQTEDLTCLAKKIDSVNEHLFYDMKISKKILREIMQCIRDSQITEGDEQGQLLLTEVDILEGGYLFTGEKLKTKLAIKNVLSQEGLRLLTLHANPGTAIDKTIQLASEWLSDACFATFCFVGECKHSTLAYIRYLNATKPVKYENQIRTFLTLLKEHRDNKGQWDGFPFYYTLLVLLEIDLPEVIAELCYALPSCEKKMIRMNNSDQFTQRRVDIIHQVYEKCQYDLMKFTIS